MNFISMSKQEDGSVELKYCERCGGLWIRRQGHDGVYCSGCCGQMAALVQAMRRHSAGPRLPRGKNLPKKIHIECLQGVAELGVRL